MANRFSLQKILALLDVRMLQSEAELTRLQKFIHFWVLVWQSFVRNRCPVRASALSYTTLLAMIPVLAVAMSISSLFLKSKGEQQIESFIQEVVDRLVPPVTLGTNTSESTPEHISAGETGSRTNRAPVAAATLSTNNPPSASEGGVQDQRVMAAQREVAQYIHNFIQNTYSGALGATGMFFLLVTSIITLTRIEEAFNDIWGVARGRDWLVRIVNYLTAIIFGPVLLIFALGLIGSSHFLSTREFLDKVPFTEVLLSRVLPVAVICLCFALFYKLMPNTKVHFSAALIGGALAGTLWHIYNLLGFLLVTRAVNTSKIYGSLALVVLFMGGLYMVWLTVLFGAQVAYAYQNRALYLQEKICENVNQRGREFVALRLMTCLGQRFSRGLPAPTVEEISDTLGIPGRLVQQVLSTLIAGRLAVEVSGTEVAYAPARPLESINAHHVLQAMRAVQGQELVTRDEPVRAEVYGEYSRIQEAEKEVASRVTVQVLVDRAQARLNLPAQSPAEVEYKPVFPTATGPDDKIATTENPDESS
jgi:membrane protein